MSEFLASQSTLKQPPEQPSFAAATKAISTAPTTLLIAKREKNSEGLETINLKPNSLKGMEMVLRRNMKVVREMQKAQK